MRYYLDSIFSLNCRSVIDKPTRITIKSSSLIDHMYTNIVFNDVLPGIIHLDTSDQLPVFIKSNLKTKNLKSIEWIKKLDKDLKRFVRWWLLKNTIPVDTFNK